jgi:cell division transport system ATP-binding protein
MESRAGRERADHPLPLVSLRRVSRFYRPDRPALFDVSLDVFRGEFVYVTGASGAGKSTLLRILHLAEPPDTGALFVNGHDVAGLKRSAISVLRCSMGVVFQDFRLVDDLSAACNVALPLEVRGASHAEIERRVEEALERVGMGGRGGELAGGLSGGEQQRVAIARALVGDPEIILADEPTGSLDAFSANVVLDMLEGVSRRGTTIVLATHDRMLIAARPHRIVAFDGGRLIGMSSTGNASSAGGDGGTSALRGAAV